MRLSELNCVERGAFVAALLWIAPLRPSRCAFCARTRNSPARPHCAAG